MVAFTILAGGYTTFVTTLMFTTVPKPEIKVVSKSETIGNPSWLQLSPTNPGILYAANELGNGTYSTYTINDDGGLKKVANISSKGDGPAFALALTGSNKAILLNYGSGNGTFVTFADDKVNFAKSDDKPVDFSFEPPKDKKARPHQALQYNEEILVPDLGSDKVWRLGKQDSGYAIKGWIPQPEGSGPRRSLVSGKTLYTLGETKNLLTQQEIPDDIAANKAAVNVSISTIPPGVNGSDFHAAELLMPKPNSKFKAELLYVSNRNTKSSTKHPGDSIAIFATNPLRLLSHVYTGLNQIRGMQFGGREDRYLIAGGAAGGGVVVFERVAGGAYLRILARSTAPEAMNRTTFVWANRQAFFDNIEEFSLKRRSVRHAKRGSHDEH